MESNEFEAISVKNIQYEKQDDVLINIEPDKDKLVTVLTDQSEDDNENSTKNHFEDNPLDSEKKTNSVKANLPKQPEIDKDKESTKLRNPNDENSTPTKKVLSDKLHDEPSEQAVHEEKEFNISPKKNKYGSLDSEEVKQYVKSEDSHGEKEMEGLVSKQQSPSDKDTGLKKFKQSDSDSGDNKPIKKANKKKYGVVSDFDESEKQTPKKKKPLEEKEERLENKTPTRFSKDGLKIEKMVPIVKRITKKKVKDCSDSDEIEEPTVKPIIATKKRGRKARPKDSDEKPPKKRSKNTNYQSESESDTNKKAIKKTAPKGNGKKNKVDSYEDSDSNSGSEIEKKLSKKPSPKGKGRKKKVDSDEDNEDSDWDIRSDTKKKTAAKGNGKKNKVDDSEEDNEDGDSKFSNSGNETENKSSKKTASKGEGRKNNLESEIKNEDSSLSSISDPPSKGNGRKKSLESSEMEEDEEMDSNTGKKDKNTKNNTKGRKKELVNDEILKELEKDEEMETSGSDINKEEKDDFDNSEDGREQSKENSEDSNEPLTTLLKKTKKKVDSDDESDTSDKPFGKSSTFKSKKAKENKKNAKTNYSGEDIDSSSDKSLNKKEISIPKSRTTKKEAKQYDDCSDSSNDKPLSKSSKSKSKIATTSKTVNLEATEKKVEEAPEITRFKRYFRAAGIFVRYNKVLEGCKSKKLKVEILTNFLREAGLKGDINLGNCKRLKEKRARAKEVAELDKNNIINETGKGRSRRKVHSLYQSKKEDFSEESDSNKPVPNPEIKKTYSRLKGIVDSEEDSD